MARTGYINNINLSDKQLASAFCCSRSNVNYKYKNAKELIQPETIIKNTHKQDDFDTKIKDLTDFYAYFRTSKKVMEYFMESLKPHEIYLLKKVWGNNFEDINGIKNANISEKEVLEYYKVIPKANWYDERRLYRIYGSKYMSGTPFSALAFYMSKNGLETTICHESPKLFENNQGIIDKTDFNLAMNEYKEYLKYAKNNGAKIVNGVNINIALLRQKCQDGNLVIWAGEVPGGYHAILLTGYNQAGFMVCDPLYKTKQRKTYVEIEKFMDTSIGKWFISVSDKTKEKDNLLSNLSKCNEEAQDLMKKQQNRSRKHVRK